VILQPGAESGKFRGDAGLREPNGKIAQRNINHKSVREGEWGPLSQSHISLLERFPGGKGYMTQNRWWRCGDWMKSSGKKPKFSLRVSKEIKLSWGEGSSTVNLPVEDPRSEQSIRNIRKTDIPS